MKDVFAPVSQALVLICEKCGRKLESKDGENPAQHLQRDLKSRFKEEFGKGVARAVLTSCMDLCPRDRIAMAIVPMANSANKTTFFELKDEKLTKASDEILAYVKDMSRKS